MNDLHLNIDVYSILESIGKIPNPPFLTSGIKRFMLDYFSKIGDTSKNYSVQFEHDRLGLYLRIKKGESQSLRKLVFIAHLDHPAFIFNNKGKGKAAGDTVFGGDKELLFNYEHPIRLYSPNGNFIDKAQVRQLKKNIFSLSGTQKVSTNTIGIWDLPDFRITDGVIEMRSCDNYISVALLLSVASSIVQNYSIDCDVTFVFPYVEEILQLSMVGISIAKKVPTTIFDDNTIFIGVDVSPLRLKDSDRHFLQKLEIETPDLFKGPLIQVADTGLVFGNSSQEKDNLAEFSLFQSAKGTIHQYTICNGRSDLTPLSIFTNYPNVAGLLIPCWNVHNIDPNGMLSCEKVNSSDVLSAWQILTNLVSQSNTSEATFSSLSNRLKNVGFTAHHELENMRKQWRKAYQVNSVRLANNFFFPSNINNVIALIKGKLDSISSITTEGL